MKKILFLFSILAMCMCFSSCSKEEQEDEYTVMYSFHGIYTVEPCEFEVTYATPTGTETVAHKMSDMVQYKTVRPFKHGDRVFVKIKIKNPTRDLILTTRCFLNITTQFNTAPVHNKVGDITKSLTFDEKGECILEHVLQ